jgi:hypothetical protein
MITLKQIPLVLALIAVCYILAYFLVFLSAIVGPYLFEHFANYTVETPYKISASDATSYTLQALLAILIGVLLTDSK